MIGLQNPFSSFSLRTVIFRNILAKFFIVLNFDVYPNCFKEVISPSGNQCIKNTLLHTESFTKVFLHQARRSMDHVHHSNKNSMPRVWITVISRKLSCHEVYVKIGMHQRNRQVWPDEYPDIIVMLRCLDVKSSGGKRKERYWTK